MRPNQLEHRGVAVEVAVPALRFVGRIAHVRAVALGEAIIGVFGARFAVPGPEIGAQIGPACARLDSTAP